MVPGSCWNPSVVENLSCFVAAFSAFLDFLFAVYPPFFLAKLNMPLHKRIVISLALGGGFVAGAVAIYKETLVAGISKAGKEDPTCLSPNCVSCPYFHVDADSFLTSCIGSLDFMDD